VKGRGVRNLYGRGLVEDTGGSHGGFRLRGGIVAVVELTELRVRQRFIVPESTCEVNQETLCGILRVAGPSLQAWQ
jgi:hypothetical protein